MRGSTQTTAIALLVTMALATTSFAQAHNVPGASVSVEPVTVRRGGLSGALEPPEVEVPVLPTSPQPVQRVLGTLSGVGGKSKAGAVLVIPSAQMKPQNSAALIEDMTIMSRIFEKRLADEHLIPSGYSFWSSRSADPFNRFFSTDTRTTEAIYVEGFGSLFLINVDFPLSPPPQVEPAKPEEGTDQVWEQIKEDMYRPEGSRRRKEDQRKQEYDAEKVDDLQRTLIKTLKHAANIQVLKPDDWVILTVTGSGKSAVIDSAKVIPGTGQIMVHYKDDDVTRILQSSSFSDLSSSSPTVLTICARKSDIDAFSKGELDYDQFRQRIQTTLALAQAKCGTDRVLVVLTGQMKAEDIAATTEDLSIMSRIFDKKMGYASAGQIYTSRLSANIDGLLSNLRHRVDSQGAQTIYLHPYGALFLMSVDFPLSAPPKVDVEKVQKDVDPLWEGTKREISTSRKTPGEDYVYVKYDSAKEYDAEKVEDLKTNLTKALRHAANIRNLKPDELIILAVAGTQQPSADVAEIAVKDGKTYRVIASNADMGPLFGAAPALLTIRAKKSDIDAYAKDQLDLDKFRERVQFLTSYFNLGPARAEEIQWRARY